MCGCVFECTSFGNCARVTQNCPQVAQNRARSSCLVQIPGLQNCKSSTNLKNRYNCQKNYTIWDFSSFSSVVGNPKGVLFCSTNDGPGLTKLRLQTKQKKTTWETHWKTKCREKNMCVLICFEVCFSYVFVFCFPYRFLLQCFFDIVFCCSVMFSIFMCCKNNQ